MATNIITPGSLGYEEALLLKDDLVDKVVIDASYLDFVTVCSLVQTLQPVPEACYIIDHLEIESESHWESLMSLPSFCFKQLAEAEQPLNEGVIYFNLLDLEVVDGCFTNSADSDLPSNDSGSKVIDSTHDAILDYEPPVTNHELLIGNTKLKSENEELKKANEELVQTIKYLDALNDDINNIIKSTKISAIFLDKELKIRKYTPSLSDYFNIDGIHIGDSIDSYAHNIGNPSIVADGMKVIETAQPIRKEITVANGKWYMQRIMPFTDSNEKVQGVVISFVDIDEMKQVEADYKASEAKLRSIFDNTPMGICLIDRNGDAIEANDSFIKLFGYEGQDVTELNLMTFTYPDDLEQAEDCLTKLMTGQESSIELEKRYVRSDGTMFWGFVVASVICDGDGNPAYIAGMIEDIDARKAHQEKLRLSEERYRVLYEDSPVMHLNIDPQDSLVIDCNKLLVKRLGYKNKSEVVGKSIFSLYHEDCLIDVKRAFDQFTERGVVHNEELLVRKKDGSKIPVLLNVASFRDKEGKILYSMSTWVEMTRVKREQLKFKALIELIPHIGWMADRKGHVTYLNRAWTDILGFDIKSSLGTTWTQYLHPEDAPNLLHQWKSTFKQGIEYEGGCRFITKSGKVVYTSFIGIPVKDEQGKVIHWVGVNFDITELTLRQEELKRTNRDLEQFAYVASHDLKAPVMNMKNLLRIIQSDRVRDRDKAEAFDKLIRSVSGMNETIRALNQVIDIKKNLILDREYIQFDQILGEVLDNLEIQLNENEVELKSDFSQCPYINYPPVHLKHIIQNFVSNSIKYKRTDRRSRVCIYTMKNTDQECLVIRDNGRGIDLPEYGDKLFGLFQRFHLDVMGNGIGLHVTKNIVESYGGHIEVESEVDTGTTFKVFF